MITSTPGMGPTPPRAVRQVPRITSKEIAMPNLSFSIAAALTIHVLIFAWNPTIISGSKMEAPPELNVRFQDKLPQLDIPKPVEKPPEKKPPVAKKKEHHKKAKKSGLVKPKPLPPPPKVMHKPVPKPATMMPKFVPHMQSDEPITGIPHPTKAEVPQLRTAPAMNAGTAVLKGKSRGVRMDDVRFKLEDGGALTGANRKSMPTIAIPVGEERGDTAVMNAAPSLHQTAHSKKLGSGSFTPGATEAGLANRGTHQGRISVDVTSMGDDTASTSHSRKAANASGFDIGGPVGDRKVLHRQVPEYPEWAEEKGISAMVKIYFTVKPDGTVRKTMQIKQSSGYSELDSLAKEALGNWRFSPTSSDSSEEAWGLITFRFTLN